MDRGKLDGERVRVWAGSEKGGLGGMAGWALLRGLYPPIKGGEGDGYQYGRVETVGGNDWNSIWIEGSDRCPNHALLAAFQINTTTYKKTIRTSTPLYTSTIPQLFSGVIPDEMVTYHNAPSLYDYASYATLHNSSVASSLPATSLARMKELAGMRNWGVYGVDKGDTDEEVMLKPIAGRTFAARALYLLSRTTMSTRPGDLDILFTSFAPFTGFAAISGLAEHDSRFKGVVEPGSMMIFEVFSYNTRPEDAEGAAPEKKDLWVRFLHRNGTAEGSRIVQYPLFGRGRSRMDMRFEEFESEMGKLGVGVGEWCETCGGHAGWYCPRFLEELEKVRKEGEGGEKGGEEKQGGEEKKGGEEKGKGGKDGKDGRGKGDKGKTEKKGTTALELGLGLGAAGLVIVFGVMMLAFYTRTQKRARTRERVEEGGKEGLEMDDRVPTEEGFRGGPEYRNEDEEAAVNPIGEPVRVEDRF